MKGDTPDPVAPGDVLTYVLNPFNIGPSDAENLIVSDTLPSGVTLSSVSSLPNVCSSLPCNIGTLTPNTSVKIILTVTVDTTTLGTITNTASISGDTFDPDATNNFATETTLVAEADLSITKTDDPGTTVPGGTLTYTLTVNNAGPSDAEEVGVSDFFPAGVTFVSVDPRCVLFSTLPPILVPPGFIIPDIICDLGTFASGSTTIDITVTVDSTTLGTITNEASVSSTTPDPDSSNNDAT